MKSGDNCMLVYDNIPVAHPKTSSRTNWTVLDSAKALSSHGGTFDHYGEGVRTLLLEICPENGHKSTIFRKLDYVPDTEYISWPRYDPRTYDSGKRPQAYGEVNAYLWARHSALRAIATCSDMVATRRQNRSSCKYRLESSVQLVYSYFIVINALLAKTIQSMVPWRQAIRHI